MAHWNTFSARLTGLLSCDVNFEPAVGLCLKSENRIFLMDNELWLDAFSERETLPGCSRSMYF